jgi:hypothetical protein
VFVLIDTESATATGEVGDCSCTALVRPRLIADLVRALGTWSAGLVIALPLGIRSARSVWSAACKRLICSVVKAASSWPRGALSATPALGGGSGSPGDVRQSIALLCPDRRLKNTAISAAKMAISSPPRTPPTIALRGVLFFWAEVLTGELV